MRRDRIFSLALFTASFMIPLLTNRLTVDHHTFIKALIVYLIFSVLYYHLRINSKNGSTSIDYGISYSLSFAIFTGPIGLFIYEILHRFTVYFYKKQTKTADPDEFFDTFYNIGSFVLINSITYYLFVGLYPSFEALPFGFWILLFLLVCITSLLSDFFLIIVLYLAEDIQTFKESIDFIKSRSLLDISKISFTNGLLLVFLQEQKWEILLSLFILNYLVSRSFASKAQNIQNKLERDRFEQMAYTDFLTGVPNRAFMDKKMAELGESDATIAIIVADIDSFKKINDSFNHAVGDKVIQHFALTLKNYLRPDDNLFRSGGEEFTIFLRNRKYETSLKLVESILHGVAESKVNVDYQDEEVSLTYTASFGLYYFKINDRLSMEKGYICADQLLLHSKELGKNTVSAKNDLG